MLKKIFDNLKENWITYGFETLVVVVGILVAFGLNNWNEERKLRSLEQSTLLELQASLKRDTTTLSQLIRRAKQRVASAEEVVSYFETNSTYRPEMARQFARAYQSYIEFPMDLIGFQSLQERGTDLIEDEDLRNSIIYFYSREYENMKRMFDRFYEVHLTESDRLYGYFTYKRNENDNFIMVPDTYELVMKDKFIKNAYYHLLNLAESQETMLMRHRDKSIELLDHLNAAINHNEHLN